MKTLLEVLLHIRKNGPKSNEHGICSQIYQLLECEDAQAAKDQFNQYAEKWEKYSGYSMFPVPSGRADQSPIQAYFGTIKHWDRRTRYGRLRWELVDFLIDSL